MRQYDQLDVTRSREGRSVWPKLIARTKNAECIALDILSVRYL